MLCPQFLTSSAFPAISHNIHTKCRPVYYSCFGSWCMKYPFLPQGLCTCHLFYWERPFSWLGMAASLHFRMYVPLTTPSWPFLSQIFLSIAFILKITLICIYLFSVCLCIKDVSSVKVLWKQSLGLSWFTTMLIKVYWVNKWTINLLDMSVYGITHLPPLFLVSPWPILWL